MSDSRTCLDLQAHPVHLRLRNRGELVVPWKAVPHSQYGWRSEKLVDATGIMFGKSYIVLTHR